MVKTAALFVFFAIFAYTNLRGFGGGFTLAVLVGLASLVLAVIYFLELIGRPVQRPTQP
jgi:hypothetical protein